MKTIFTTFIIIALLFVSIPAMAVDPECAGLDYLNPTVPALLDVTDDEIRFCTAPIDVDGDPIPATGYEQTCTLDIGGTVFVVVTDAHPGQLVTVAALTGFKYELPLSLFCENQEGRSAAVASRGTFPAVAPRGPVLLEP